MLKNRYNAELATMPAAPLDLIALVLYAFRKNDRLIANILSEKDFFVWIVSSDAMEPSCGKKKRRVLAKRATVMLGGGEKSAFA